jgi:1,4-dihydroxy-2-naphthoate octaprenyltransferase
MPNRAEGNLSGVKLWIVASRPKTLPAAVAPVLVGTAVAVREGVFKPLPAFLALIVSLLIQIGTNFVNDYGDYKKGTDKKDRVGPQRFLTLGIITPAQMKKAIVVTFVAAFVAGLYLVRLGGLPALAVGVLSILAGIAYTAGPFPLAYNGLGDIFVLVFFGFVATAGTYYVQALTVSPLVLWASLPVGLLITNILVVNNYRDADDDKRANKKTLAVIFGKSFARAQYAFSLALAYLTLAYLYFNYDFSCGIFLPILLLPFGIKLTKEIFTLTGSELNFTLAKTAMFAALFSLLFSVGLIL